jgi:hypothetical protein
MVHDDVRALAAPTANLKHAQPVYTATKPLQQRSLVLPLQQRPCRVFISVFSTRFSFMPGRGLLESVARIGQARGCRDLVGW